MRLVLVPRRFVLKPCSYEYEYTGRQDRTASQGPPPARLPGRTMKQSREMPPYGVEYSYSYEYQFIRTTKTKYHLLGLIPVYSRYLLGLLVPAVL
eukprot:scaffold289078_cov21-Prasinocladus_malaysianus.AAC.1